VDPAAVAAHYRAKGYTVHEAARAKGLSGNEHRVPLLAEGPLGSLAIFFGDFGGVDGPEMGGARKVARDLGATPVLVADSFSNQDRQIASRLGVVLMDADALAAEPAPAPATAAWPGLQARPGRPEPQPEPHPWPASGRADGRGTVDIDLLLAKAPSAGAPVDPVPEEPEDPTRQVDDGEGLWKHPRAAAAPSPSPAKALTGGRFAWLGLDDPAPETRGPLAVEYDDVVPSRRPAPPAKGTAGFDASQPDPHEDAARGRRDRWQRRLFWTLFAFVVLYLVLLWWL
jgi:hypothetical protein